MIFNDPALISCYSRRRLNFSLNCGETKDALKNRAAFLRILGIDYKDLVCAKQSHGAQIVYAQEEDRGRGAVSYDSAFEGSDGFITDKENVPLAVFTADCLCVFLYDRKSRAIGLAHAGWKGSKERILAKTVALMRQKFNTDSKDLLAGFGPAIRSCCYEVGAEFKSYFSEGIEERKGHLFLDLIKINQLQLLDSGVREANITDTKICTACRNNEYFSFRREGKDCGRMISVIMLRDGSQTEAGTVLNLSTEPSPEQAKNRPYCQGGRY